MCVHTCIYTSMYVNIYILVLQDLVMTGIHMHICIHMYVYVCIYIHVNTKICIYSLLHLECNLVSIANLNLLGLFSTKRSKGDLEN